MSCCGKSRIQFKPGPPIAIQPVGTVTFEYTGRSRLTVIGPVTRRRALADRPSRQQLHCQRSRPQAGLAHVIK
jgi:hypothetical protein